MPCNGGLYKQCFSRGGENVPKGKRKSALSNSKTWLQNLKYEVANELNLPREVVEKDYWGNLTAAQCGAVGGHMVKRMIEAAEAALAEQVAASVKAGFRQGLSGDWVPNSTANSTKALKSNKEDQPKRDK
ncbi:MAG: alpha/beta-type small acid-soluble spore protein [Firmicutes bacterium]|nr:alpha/beta-type small acid-soluble spore protein [Bacillota bacterium]